MLWKILEYAQTSKKTLILKSSKCPYALNMKARSNMSVHIRQKNLAFNCNKKI